MGSILPGNLGVNLTCNSNCTRWCPRSVEIDSCCSHAVSSDKSSATDSRPPTPEDVVNAIRQQQGAEEIVAQAIDSIEAERKKGCRCTIL